MLDSMFEHRVRKMARPTEEELGDDFSYIIRMADADVDGLKPLATALTSIKGIGHRTAHQICKLGGFDAERAAGFLDKDQQAKLVEMVESYAENVPLWMLNRQRAVSYTHLTLPTICSV